LRDVADLLEGGRLRLDEVDAEFPQRDLDLRHADLRHLQERELLAAGSLDVLLIRRLRRENLVRQRHSRFQPIGDAREQIAIVSRGGLGGFQLFQPHQQLLRRRVRQRRRLSFATRIARAASDRLAFVVGRRWLRGWWLSGWPGGQWGPNASAVCAVRTWGGIRELAARRGRATRVAIRVTRRGAIAHAAARLRRVIVRAHFVLALLRRDRLIATTTNCGQQIAAHEDQGEPRERAG